MKYVYKTFTNSVVLFGTIMLLLRVFLRKELRHLNINCYTFKSYRFDNIVECPTLWHVKQSFLGVRQ